MPSETHLSTPETTIQDDHPSEIIDEEQIQLYLDPKLQDYLSGIANESGCWGRFFPIPFERAAEKSWWNPTFDSEILEEQYKKSSFPYSRMKFRFAIWYTIWMASGWLIYIFYSGLIMDFNQWPIRVILFTFLLFYNGFVLYLTYKRDYFQEHISAISFIYALSCIVISFLFSFASTKIHVAHFSICVQLLILIYTLIPLKLYMALTLAVFYSISFELMEEIVFTSGNNYINVSNIITKILSHIAIHLIGWHIYLMNNVRSRQTFMKVGQSLLVRKQLELEKKFKENMIHSLMPPSVANCLLKDDENVVRRHSSESENNDIIGPLFRPFHMTSMNNVSILFADIVGFTRMSSNKSAEELVEILNNLFQRFDDLCIQHCCEKISTLGDCYYCVSGCPNPRNDHAQCCVEMGLSMIKAIKKFDQEKHEGINMRVGIHTGTVLCGIVGMKRFKFDVWSNDVTLANKMESTGKPGKVHISEKTSDFLNNQYFLEDAECVAGMKTYFILGRRNDRSPSTQRTLYNDGIVGENSGNPLLVSSLPPPPLITSPQLSLAAHARPRILSCDTSHIKRHSRNYLSPDSCILKASSLPSILDSENEQEPPEGATIESIKTPTSTSSSGKYSIKQLRNWKIPKFMRKQTGVSSKPEIDVDFISGATDTSEDGYQQIPTIIESDSLTGKKKDSVTTLTSKHDDDHLNKEMLDIKSYISHSRSDIGAYEYSGVPEFIRAGSYRSQYGRSYNGDFSMLNRAGSNRSRRGRSPNLEAIEAGIGRSKRSIDIPSRLSSIAKLDEYSVNSRKDSGIKSNSRRSSIQQIENTHMNQEMLQHRVSGYYTSSQSSLNSSQVTKLTNQGPHGVLFDKSSIKNLRKQSDRQLIKCVQDNSKSESSYFIKPPISQWTLFFKEKDMEQDYRANVHYIPVNAEINTLANSPFHTYLDICISLFVFLIVSIDLALVSGITYFWIITASICLLFQLFNFCLCIVPVIRYTDRVFHCSSRFCRWNLFGAILVSLPMLSTVLNFVPDKNITDTHLHIFTYVLFVGLVHFCNFTQLNCWMKNCIVTILSVAFIVLFIMNQCAYAAMLDNNNNSTDFILINKLNSTNRNSSILTHLSDAKCYFNNLDLIINITMIVILVWLLNREFEIGYRLSFHSNYTANRDKVRIQKLKNQADYLIYNIVPEHVADRLKKDAKYSENFPEIAIIFASIVNFNEMYDESFAGGKEFLRVLNELIGDFDELLAREQFECVEKIKTIGSTFMAASGLNSKWRSRQHDPHEHLYVLMEFAMEMQKVVESFNRNLLEFNLIIRIGYNFGEVTAAVIGNTKLYYDIWGDAVNIASRMDSTGVNGRIQVGEHCLPILKRKFDFEYRGNVYVKGKDNMNVYLLKGKRPNSFAESNNIYLSIPNIEEC